MKPKPIIIAVIVALCLGLGVYFLVKSRGAALAADDESAGENVLTVVSVQTGALQRMTLHRYITGYGAVGVAPAMENEPAAGALLAAPSAGVVVQVNVIEGQPVQKGDVLAELNSGTATFDSAQAEAERQKKLFAQNNTSLKNLQDAEAQLAALEVVAPLSGTVTRVAVKPGEAADVNAPVAEVVDLSRLAVSAKIPAAEAGELKNGEAVQISTEPPVTATLSFVSPAVDAADGTVLARALLPVDSGLRPGQFVQLKIVTAVHTNCLAAPEISVVTDESGRSVIALVHGDEATQTPVQAGFRENGWVEIEGNGLKAGDTVVTIGAYGLPDKTKILIVNGNE
jgi:multidrug efflux pump subunit AcrA (membrane-fusion protein)